MRGQSGQTLVIFALVCSFILMGTIALVGNTQVLFVNYDRADSAALLAAQAGASAIDQQQLYNNKVVLSVADAKKRCQDAAMQAQLVISVTCDVSITNGTVTAVVVERVDMPVPLWSVAETVSATRTARPAYGGHIGGF